MAKLSCFQLQVKLVVAHQVPSATFCLFVISKAEQVVFRIVGPSCWIVFLPGNSCGLTRSLAHRGHTSICRFRAEQRKPPFLSLGHTWGCEEAKAANASLHDGLLPCSSFGGLQFTVPMLAFASPCLFDRTPSLQLSANLHLALSNSLSNSRVPGVGFHAVGSWPRTSAYLTY